MEKCVDLVLRMSQKIDYAFRQLSKNHPVIAKLRFGQNCEANTAGLSFET